MQFCAVGFDCLLVLQSCAPVQHPQAAADCLMLLSPSLPVLL